MVQIVSRQTRQEAIRQQGRIQQQQQQLARQGRQITTAQAIRKGGREALITRQQTGRAISSAQGKLKQQSSQLERISKLPTRSEALAKFKAEITSKFRQARQLASKIGRGGGLPIASIRDKATRQLAIKIREGLSLGELVSEGEREFKATLTTIDPDVIFGITPQTPKGRVVKGGFRTEDITLRGLETPDLQEVGVPEEIKIDIGGVIRKVGGKGIVQIEKRITEPVKKFLVSKGVIKADNIAFRKIFNAGDVALGLFFEPLFFEGKVSKGARTKQVTKQKAKGKVKVKPTKKEVKELETAIQEFFLKANKPAQREKVREIVRKFQSNPQELIKSKSVLDRILGKKVSNELFKDVLEQEGLVGIRQIQKQGSVAIQKQAVKPKPKPQKQVLVKDIPAQIRGAGGITGAKVETPRPTIVGGEGVRGAFTGKGQFERTNETLANKVGSPLQQRQQELQKAGLIQPSLTQVRQQQRQEIDQLKRTLQLQGVSPAQMSKQVQQLRQQQRLDQAQQIKQKQEQKQRQRQRQRQRLSLGLRTRQAQKQRQRGRGRGRFRPRTRLRPRPRLKFPLPFTSGVKKKKKGTKRPTLGIQKQDVFVRRFGKDVRITNKPFRSKKKALDFLAHRLDTTLRASGFTKPSTRSGFKRLPKAFDGFLARNKNKFRPSKINPKRLVEKRQFRLSGKGETQAIQKFRKLKKLQKPFIKRKRS